MEFKSQTADRWLEEMKSCPCYRPAVPFYDVCLNSFAPNIKKLDCEICVARHELVDCIE